LDSEANGRAIQADPADAPSFFESSTELFLATDSAGRILYASPSAVTILGRHPNEMIGVKAREYILGDDLDAARQETRALPGSNAARGFYCRYKHKDGRPVILWWTGMWSARVRQFFFVGRDMSAQPAGRPQQPTENVGEVTGRIAHSLNNLLMVIFGNIDMLCDREELEAESRKLAQVVLEAAQRSTELVVELSELSRQYRSPASC